MFVRAYRHWEAWHNSMAADSAQVHQPRIGRDILGDRDLVVRRTNHVPAGAHSQYP